jgi:anti-sigma factor RsiW
MGPEQRLTPVERANLVAYLDGELNEVEARALSTKLTLSPTARREVEALEKTWELLERLPRPIASEALTERTLSEIKRLSERGGQFETAVKLAVRRSLRALLWVGASAIAFAVGFAITSWAWPNPTANLASDLPLAEHFDEYRDVGTFENLKELADSPDFGSERND